MGSFLPIIGLEIHVELKTKSKMFCGCKNDPFHAPGPNVYTCPVCLGLPGALPVPNRKAIEWTIRLGHVLGCQSAETSKFDRKNYFYPDLPKGYQISQYDEPFSKSGRFEGVRIRRVHLEEDTGKLFHSAVGGRDVSLVDFNRSGVPLVEIVTEPELRSAEEAKVFLREIQKVVRYLGISEANMEEGTMRLEPSISLGRGEEELPNYRVEIKNINSFKFVQKALDYEVRRQEEILKNGGVVGQETRGYDEAKGETVFQRSKEEASDYRYFPEPDVPPIKITPAYLEEILRDLPELPREKERRYVKDFDLRQAEASIIVEDPSFASRFESLVAKSRSSSIVPQDLANLLVNKKVLIEGRSDEAVLAEILRIQSLSTASLTAEEREDLAKTCLAVLAENDEAAAAYRSGQAEKVLGPVIAEIRARHKNFPPREIVETLRKLLGGKNG